MGTPLSPKYIPYPYMDPLGLLIFSIVSCLCVCLSLSLSHVMVSGGYELTGVSVGSRIGLV